jgi:N-terminal acetyltransferase B complex non-catalytic subunit
MISLLEELRECLDEGLKALPDSRDLLYGTLRLLQLERVKGRCTAQDLLDACKQYFSVRCEHLSCFDELRGPLDVLDSNYQQNFVDLTNKAAIVNSESEPSSIIRVLNALKLEYFFLMSPQTATDALQDFSRKVVETYQQFCSTKRDSGEPGSQLPILACMALLQTNPTEQEGTVDQNLQHVSDLQAGFLLRYCLARFRDNYPILVVLTRITTLLGAISMSAKFFKKLSIKNLQWENAGHLLLTRLSTLHPQGSKGGEGSFDPLQMLDLATSANANSVRSVRRLIMVGLNNKSYVSVMETISLREDLKKSFSKQMYRIETARSQRQRGISSTEGESVSPGEAQHATQILMM